MIGVAIRLIAAMLVSEQAPPTSINLDAQFLNKSSLEEIGAKLLGADGRHVVQVQQDMCLPALGTCLVTLYSSPHVAMRGVCAVRVTEFPSGEVMSFDDKYLFGSLELGNPQTWDAYRYVGPADPNGPDTTAKLCGDIRVFGGFIKISEPTELRASGVLLEQAILAARVGGKVELAVECYRYEKKTCNGLTVLQSMDLPPVIRRLDPICSEVSSLGNSLSCREMTVDGTDGSYTVEIWGTSHPEKVSLHLQPPPPPV